MQTAPMLERARDLGLETTYDRVHGLYRFRRTEDWYGPDELLDDVDDKWLTASQAHAYLQTLEEELRIEPE
jgi:hypothetical protein